MKEKIGTGYEKYIIEGNLSPSDMTGKQISTKIPIAIDSSIQSRGTAEIYYTGLCWLTFYGRYLRLPWGSWCWCGSGIQTVSGDFLWSGSGSSYTQYHDEVTPPSLINEITATPSEWAYIKSEVSGNMKWGFFPVISPINSYHRVTHAMISQGTWGELSNWQGSVSESTWYSDWVSWSM